MKIEAVLTNENRSKKKQIVSGIRDLIISKNLESGDKLPSERSLSEKFGVNRNHVREALQQLEFYGIIESIPQSGTFLADIGRVAINGIVDDILRLKESDFLSLVETRILLELKIVELAAKRRTEEDLLAISVALEAYSEKAIDGQDAVQEDLLFHLAIAKACKNSTMNTLMLLITPGIITNFEKHHVCDKKMTLMAVEEHADIFEAIRDQRPEVAIRNMMTHFKVLYQYCDAQN